jgi:hypothetical protein
MGRRGRNRDKRNAILARIEEADPALHAELVELRSISPQEYRKKLRYWVQYYPIPNPQKVMANRGAKYKGLMLDTVDILSEPFQIMRNSIKAGNVDDLLDELEGLERAGRNRPVVFEIIDARREAMAAPPRPAELPRAPRDWRAGEGD